MASKHTLKTVCPQGNDGEGMEVEIAFLFTPGCSEMPPAYNHGGLPADDAEIELISVKAVGGLLDPAYMQSALDEWATDALAGDLYDEALLVVADDDEAGREYAAEDRRERMREGE